MKRGGAEAPGPDMELEFILEADSLEPGMRDALLGDSAFIQRLARLLRDNDNIRVARSAGRSGLIPNRSTMTPPLGVEP